MGKFFGLFCVIVVFIVAVLLTGNGLRTVTVSKTIGCSNSKNLCLSNRENDNHNYELAPTSEKSKFSNLLYGVVRTSSSVLIPVLLGSTKSLASDEPVITDKIYMDIKIANYTEESIGKNKGASGSGRIVIGLYGKAAPESVKIFLDTIKSDGKESPTYYNSLFSRISDEGLLEIEKIRGVNTITLAGSEQLEYAGNVLDYKPILETNSIKHDR